MQKRGLGRGLEALIPDIDAGPPAQPQEIPVGDVMPNALQPRRRFDDAKMEELVKSVKEHGVVQPVLVRRRGDRYELIAGERRWRAAQAAGLRTVPAVVREMGDREVMEVALIENLQREDLNPMEEAEAFERLAREFGLTQEETASRVGKSRTHITNMIRLLQLHEPVQMMVRDGRLSMGHARAIVSLRPAEQSGVAQAVVDRGLSVRETESLARKIAAGDKGKKSRGSKVTGRGAGTAELGDAEGLLMEALGTRVRIEGNERKGRIEISFYSRDDLERIVGIILGGKGETQGKAAGKIG
ncbi:MAG: ParB/RepB/Spo0J family partition protein [Firmicutes bacterium]|nr:ParB/RepB/Spo0J family partition protein [Bacillota bacterium]